MMSPESITTEGLDSDTDEHCINRSQDVRCYSHPPPRVATKTFCSSKLVIRYDFLKTLTNFINLYAQIKNLVNFNT
jgi:hypothetical protein